MAYDPSLVILGNRDVKSSNEMGDVLERASDGLWPGSPEALQLIYRVYVQSFRLEIMTELSIPAGTHWPALARCIMWSDGSAIKLVTRLIQAQR